jgi:hypothetical protein
MGKHVTFGIAAVVVAGAAGTVAVAGQREGRAALQPVPVVHAAHAGAVATNSVTLRYLPEGAYLAHSDDDDARFPGVRSNSYQLAGAANADTVPPEGATETNYRDVHPAVQVEVSFVPGLRALPEVTTDPLYYDQTLVDIAGHQALLATPKGRPYGVQRVDWIDGAGYHVVMCERLTHVEGVAGIEAGELLEVARSLYA